MNITVFGATGKVGRLLVTDLLAAGHEVTAFIHQTKLEPRPRLKLVKDSIGDPTSVQQAVRGADIVFSALGSWGTPSKDIVGSATSVLIPAMQAVGVRRLITVTGSAALAPGDAPGLLAKLSRRFLTIVAPKILADGDRHIALLTASSLDWTIIRSPAMIPGARRTYRLSARPQSLLSIISRRAVVQSMLDQIHDTTHLAAAPIIYRQ